MAGVGSQLEALSADALERWPIEADPLIQHRAGDLRLSLLGSQPADVEAAADRHAV